MSRHRKEKSKVKIQKSKLKVKIQKQCKLIKLFIFKQNFCLLTFAF